MREISFLALLGIAGACGTIARYAVHTWANPFTESIPCGTLLVNIIGCFLLGMLTCATRLDGSILSPQMSTALGTGFLGAFTTFSTFGVETFERLQRGEVGYALANIGLNVIIGLLAVWLSYIVVTWLIPIPTT